MKRVIFFLISFFFLGKTNCQVNDKFLHPSTDLPYQIPAADQVIKMAGKNVTDIVLSSPQTFIARNQDITVLLTPIKDSGTYLIIYKLAGEDTNTFYPVRTPQLPIDSAGNFMIEVNNKSYEEAQQFLNEQVSSFSDSIDYKINFLSNNNQISTVAVLKANDTVSLHCILLASEGNIFTGVNKSAAPANPDDPASRFRTIRPKWVGNWVIKKAELLIIKIN